MSTLTIPLNLIADQNKMIGVSLSQKGRYMYAKKRRETLAQLKLGIELQIRQKDFTKWNWPSILVFKWTLSNYRRDPDNISSAGRKFILDAMQQATYLNGNIFLPNDNLKHIQGFKDYFIVNKNIEHKDETVVIQSIPMPAI